MNMESMVIYFHRFHIHYPVVCAQRKQQKKTPVFLLRQAHQNKTKNQLYLEWGFNPFTSYNPFFKRTGMSKYLPFL
jgi:hypothetical protein